MAEIHRFSLRRQRLDHAFLANRLQGAKSYKRIAGYFRNSIFELVGKEIANIPHIQIVWNSALDAADVAVSKHVRKTALKERWNEVPVEVEALLHRGRYRRLHALLTSGRVEIRVVPKDRVFGDACAAVERDDIKKAVKHHDIRLVVATDAACEGLNLQTLGTFINVDLPWNPSRLEQRFGRIKRFGQARRTVDVLNLVYHATQDEKVYQVLSRRLRDKFDIFGGLPDTIEDDWIESAERLEAMMDTYIHLRQQSRDVFELRYKETIDPDKNRWELCSRVLARKDVVEKLSESW
jgi:hypothetical protein